MKSIIFICIFFIFGCIKQNEAEVLLNENFESITTELEILDKTHVKLSTDDSVSGEKSLFANSLCFTPSAAYIAGPFNNDYNIKLKCAVKTDFGANVIAFIEDDQNEFISISAKGDLAIKWNIYESEEMILPARRKLKIYFDASNKKAGRTYFDDLVLLGE